MRPEEDGMSHINVYSKGKTLLGQMLSNFYKCTVATEDGEFASVEGYWYWLSSKDDKLRQLSGFEAKKYGQFIRAPDWVEGDEFKRKIKVAIRNKIIYNKNIKEEITKSSLPFVHYYVYGDKVVKVPKGQWIMDYLEEIRLELKSC